MVHPYRLRNRDSILLNLKQGDITLGFAETVDDFMNQFYTFKSFLMRIGFLERDSHFAFNLSNVHGFKEGGRHNGRGSEAVGAVIAQSEIMEVVFSYMSSQENLGIGRVSRGFRDAVSRNWERRAGEQEERIRTL